MAKPILPTANQVLTPAIDAIVAARPESLVHFNLGGRWADLPAMWRAQLLLALARLSDEAKSARLRFATGDELKSLCASEFNTRLPAEPQVAIGSIAYSRVFFGIGLAPGGVIARKG